MFQLSGFCYRMSLSVDGRESRPSRVLVAGSARACPGPALGSRWQLRVALWLVGKLRSSFAPSKT